MKNIIVIIMIMVMTTINAQPGLPPTITLDIDNNKILSGDFENKYLVSVKTLTDTIIYEKPIESEFYQYINNKNFHEFENISKNYVVFYLKKLLPLKIIRLSFFDKEQEQEMNIYFRFKEGLSYGDNIKLNSIAFHEGDYFYDMCDNCMYKANYIKIDYNENLLEVKDIPKHKIKIKKLKKLIVQNKCD